MSQDPRNSHLASRREFLRRSIAASSLLLFARSSLGAEAPRPPRRLRLALVGIGNRGTDHVREFRDSGLVDFVAAADVHYLGKHCDEARELLTGIPLYQDFREMLARHGDEIEAVSIATPDFSHFPIAMACMAAGKHIYVEKPLAQTFGEIEMLMEQARRTGVVTQMGNQGHSGANYYQFKAWIEAGIIKDVTRIDAYMNGSRRWHGWNVTGFDSGDPVPENLDWDGWHTGRGLRPYSPRLHPQTWRGWFEFGSGAIGDWAAHLIDTAHRFLDLGLPTKIEVLRRDGPNDYIFPQASTLRYSIPARGSMPPCELTWYDGVDNLPPLPDSEAPDAQRQNAGKYIYGGDTVFKGGSHEAVLRILPQSKMQDMAPKLPKIPIKFSNHFENFALACMGLEEAHSPFSVSGPLSQFMSLGIVAQRVGGTLLFDRETKRFTNNEAANQLLALPTPRPGWEQFYRF